MNRKNHHLMANGKTMTKASTGAAGNSSRTSNAGGIGVNDKLRLAYIGRFLLIVWTSSFVIVSTNFLLRVEQDIKLMENNDWRLHLPSGGTSTAIAAEWRGISEVKTDGYWKREKTDEESEEKWQWADEGGQTERTRGPRLSKLPDHILLITD